MVYLRNVLIVLAVLVTVYVVYYTIVNGQYFWSLAFVAFWAGYYFLRVRRK